MRLQARREHSRAELTRKLVARGFSTADIARELEALSERGWQSEDRFAESYCSMRAAAGFGPRRIRAELTERGITHEQIAEALAGLEVDWGVAAALARTKRFGSTLPDDAREKARQARFLEYRGFTHDDIRAAWPQSMIDGVSVMAAPRQFSDNLNSRLDGTVTV